MPFRLYLYVFITISFYIILNQPVFAETQYEMAKKAGAEFAKADKELTTTYNRILKEYREDKEFIEKMKAAQRAWIKFRDAHIEAVFPAKDKQSEYGSVFGMCYLIMMQQMTEARIEQLKLWLKGTEEGDVCAGSIKIK
ncbi:MAG TPA: DUF1311 domain-containing protein [Syntrophorhabdaceae bacterium]|nr:DUF1311 domain-containing protein [Syntrophorhabdaceae bacterium]